MPDWRYYGTSGVAVFFGFILRYYQEKKRSDKVDVKYQIVTSLVMSYLAYLLYRDRKIEIMSIELWLWLWSYSGSLAVTIIDKFLTIGWKMGLRMLAKRFLAYSDPEDTNNEHNDTK
jgi:hypothetical protein